MKLSVGTCPAKGKKCIFPDFETAMRAAKRQTYRNKESGLREKVVPYVCDHCGMYHIGRGPLGRDKDASVTF